LVRLPSRPRGCDISQFAKWIFSFAPVFYRLRVMDEEVVYEFADS
jgi:hypothetical protein